MSHLAKSGSAKSPAQIGRQLQANIVRYRVVYFVLFVALVYGYLGLKIATLSQQQPTDASVNNEISSISPHIDQSVAQQLENLRDNSVNVQTLFEQARKNPFHE